MLPVQAHQGHPRSHYASLLVQISRLGRMADGSPASVSAALIVELRVDQSVELLGCAGMQTGRPPGKTDRSAGPLGCPVPHLGLFVEVHRSRMAGAGPRREQQEKA